MSTNAPNKPKAHEGVASNAGAFLVLLGAAAIVGTKKAMDKKPAPTHIDDNYDIGSMLIMFAIAGLFASVGLGFIPKSGKH